MCLFFLLVVLSNFTVSQEPDPTPSPPESPAVEVSGRNGSAPEASQTAVPLESSEAGESKPRALISNDATIFGILMVFLGLVFWTSNLESPFWKKFYKFIPMLLLCYFLPSLLTFFRLVDVEQSKLYFVASRFLLPASLVLLTISVDLREILKLGPKALIMFLTGTVGVILGGPIAVFIVGMISPELVGGDGPEAVWRLSRCLTW